MKTTLSTNSHWLFGFCSSWQLDSLRLRCLTCWSRLWGIHLIKSLRTKRRLQRGLNFRSSATTLATSSRRRRKNFSCFQFRLTRRTKKTGTIPGRVSSKDCVASPQKSSILFHTSWIFKLNKSKNRLKTLPTEIRLKTVKTKRSRTGWSTQIKSVPILASTI